MQQVLDMDLGSYHEQPKMVCAVCDRSWSYGVSCNPLLRCAMPTPWYVYGLLQRDAGLLRPKRAVVNRVRQDAREPHVRRGRPPPQGGQQQDEVGHGGVVTEAYRRGPKRRPEFKNGDPRYGIYVAADGESTQTKKRIEAFARSVGAPLLERAARARPRESSVRAMQRARRKLRLVARA